MISKGGDMRRETTLPIDRDAFSRAVWTGVKRKGYTYKEAAARAQEHLPAGLRISDVSVWSYAKGKSVPRTRVQVEALGSVLGFDPAALFSRESPESDVKALDVRTRLPTAKGDERDDDAVAGIHVNDVGGGHALVRISAVVSWDVAMKILYLVDPAAGGGAP
ncbi:hypothetical protein [Salinarimonas ramus]|uniref:Uncharacterized protein n=1 Tax=Salinarimonas ramus TaxID=690164 RepID=A0A917V9Z4_9HYPH|nr:hypothetical protein [Salinarimonas ramus]GGK55209.1 hypothetical protein GCM10011322_47360 [Salinarimonas ramus]